MKVRWRALDKRGRVIPNGSPGGWSQHGFSTSYNFDDESRAIRTENEGVPAIIQETMVKRVNNRFLEGIASQYPLLSVQWNMSTWRPNTNQWNFQVKP